MDLVDVLLRAEFEGFGPVDARLITEPLAGERYARQE